MIPSLPAVQRNCRAARNLFRLKLRWAKTNINRRHRRALAQCTQRIARDPDRFDDETFAAPSLSQFELD
jgi:hypothetical protein